MKVARHITHSNPDNHPPVPSGEHRTRRAAFSKRRSSAARRVC